MLKIEDFNEDDLKLNPLMIKSAPGLPIIAFPYRNQAVDVSFNNQNILIEEEEKDIYNESPQGHQPRESFEDEIMKEMQEREIL
jgi:hypothetical protein